MLDSGDYVTRQAAAGRQDARVKEARRTCIMIIFATPDFGASGFVALFWLIVYVAIIVFAFVGVVMGAKLLAKESPKVRKTGLALILAGGMVPLFCCLGPPYITRVLKGNYPIKRYPDNKITRGMTRDEVVTILGSPHERYKQGDEDHWYYWIDSFGISWFGVNFGPDGQVIVTYGN